MVYEVKAVSEDDKTITGRVRSSSGPRPQNIPVRTPEGTRIREAFLGRRREAVRGVVVFDPAEFAVEGRSWVPGEED